MKIPKIIHQTYTSKENKYINYSNNWKTSNNNWEYIFYNDQDILDFIEKFSLNIKKDFHNFFDYFNACSKIEKIDMFRYLLMYYIGGIYSDIDTNCFKNFDSLCKEEECIFGIESYITHYKKNMFQYKFNYTIGNAILISKPHHPIFKKIINDIINNKYDNTLNNDDSEYTVQKTGPGIITKIIQNIIHSEIDNHCFLRNFMYKNEKIKILEQIILYPPTNPPLYSSFPFNINIYANHVCEGSWKVNKKNNYSTMDFIPYPWLWMYKFRIEYIISILSMYPLIMTSSLLYQNYNIQSIFVFLSFISATIYHRNEYLGNERLEIYHIIDNIFANNLFAIMYLLENYKDNKYYLNLNTILFTTIISIYFYKFYSNSIMEISFILPFILLLKKYFYQNMLLSLMAVLSFFIGLQEFDYFSSRKYHSLWHLTASTLIYNIISEII